jgi:F-type H+-transporting ATPase subunit gamma
MPSIKDLRKRIVSTKNTQQTTKAMKMVSAAKLRRAQEAIQNHRPYAKHMGELIRTLSALAKDEIHSPFMGREAAEGSKPKLLLLVVTSDRGLCGGFNANVIKMATRFVQTNRDQYQSIRLGFLGRKGYEFFKNKEFEKGAYFPELGGKVSFDKASHLADALVKSYLDGEVDEIKIIYNEFKNAASQETKVMDFLPIHDEESAGDAEAANGSYLIKPSAPQVLEELLAKNFSVQTFRIMLESQAGEHGARMSAMENATKNAGEMIRKLTLQYNKQRQAGITKELLEIISGSESQKG